MAGLKCHADLALGLEPADPGSVTSTRIDDDERPLLVIDLDALGGVRRGLGDSSRDAEACARP